MAVTQRLNSGEHVTGAGGFRWQLPACTSDDDELHTEQRIDCTSIQHTNLTQSSILYVNSQSTTTLRSQIIQLFKLFAIQCEWSKFDPSQKPNQLKDYDKTLHNWLCPRDEHVTQNLCQSAVRECLAKYVKYKASSFLFIFFPDLPTEVTRGWILTHNGSKCVVTHGSACLGSTRWPTTFWGSNFPSLPSIATF